MIEQKLIVGRYIDFQEPPAPRVPEMGVFQEVPGRVLHIAQSKSRPPPVAPLNAPREFPLKLRAQLQLGRTGQQLKSVAKPWQQVSSFGGGESAKEHRNFVWLPWLPGVVSEVRPDGIDVFTGPMSGCWIMCYRRNGHDYVGHVGTLNEDITPQSRAALRAWNQFAPLAQNLAGFKPRRDNFAPPPDAQQGELPLSPKIFALITATGNFFSVWTFSQSAKPNRLRIAAIQQIQPHQANDGRLPEPQPGDEYV